MGSTFPNRYGQSHFFEFEDKDTFEQSTQLITYLPNIKQHVTSVKCLSNLHDGSLSASLPDREIPTSSAGFDDLVELLCVSPPRQTNDPYKKSRYHASFDAFNRSAFCHKLIILAKRFDLFIRVLFFRKKRRYSFDLTTSDLGFELSSAKKKNKASNVKSQLFSAKIVQNEGVNSMALLVLLLCTLCFLWLQIMKTAFHRGDRRNTFRSRGIQRLVPPIRNTHQKKNVEEDSLLVNLKERPETITAMQVDLHDPPMGSSTKPEVVLHEKEQSDATQDKKRNQEESLNREHLAPVDMLPSFTDAEPQEEHFISFPPSFQYLANFPSAKQPGDLPVFWHIPKSGGSSIKDILAGCFQMVVADEMGAQFGHAEDQELEVFMESGNKYVNVDTTNPAGISKAVDLNLASSGLVEAVVTSYIYEASKLFSTQHRGRFFTVMRDPIERAVSMHGYLGKASWEETYDPAYATMTLEEYAQSSKIENNWMTRFLSNKMTGEVKEQDLEVAKEILRNKFVIGILKDFNKTMEHFEKYFEWQIINRPHRMKCVSNIISGGSNRHRFARDHVIKGSRAYSLLHWQNQFDMKLYHYALQLFREQSDYFDKIPRPTTGTLK